MISSFISTIQYLVNLENSVTNPTDFEGITFHSDSYLIAIEIKLEAEINTCLFPWQI
jgi:hypothetical protein